MAPIRALPPEVIGQIAAGEVVERPAAAVKELVENSIDAGATAVTVEIREGGVAYMRVTDNGSGIAQRDIRMAFARHATSKLTTAQQLHAIATLGFRGEALSSIAAVSRVTCTTRTREDEHGIALTNEGGEITDVRDAACPQGTTLLVRDLFFNAPVRRKFLKKPAAETALVSDLMMRLILSNPRVSFRYLADGKTVYHSAGDGQLRSAVMSVYGLATLKALHAVAGASGGVSLEGFVGVGDLARGNRSHQSFFLNGRAMKSALLTQALEAACRQRVTIGHFPLCVIHLTMPFESADVNVHPNKWEVRFQNERAVYDAVFSAVSQALQADTVLTRPPEISLDAPGKAPAPAAAPAPILESATVQPSPVGETPLAGDVSSAGETPGASSSAPAHAQAVPPAGDAPLAGDAPPAGDVPLAFGAPPRRAAALRETYIPAPRPAAPVPAPWPAQTKSAAPAPEQAVMPAVAERAASTIENMRLLGVAFDTYMIFECRDRLLLIDQHAAHERLLYERMMRAYDAHTASQTLLAPLMIPVTHREALRFSAWREALLQAGFDAELFGEDAISVRAVPLVLGEPQIRGFFLDLLDTLDTPGGAPRTRSERILQMACKHAVKGGERLPESALRELAARLIDEQVTPTCPHGRPLVVALTRLELDKRFKRIQN